MSLQLFEGPAGSGKTTRVFEELSLLLDARPLNEGERILALTKMHGSRRRMRHRLDLMPSARGRIDCVTADSFALRLVRRWRTLARAKGIGTLQETEYTEICNAAAILLEDEAVRSWIARTAPFVVIDEMQDCKGGQMQMVRALTECSTCLAAGDEYQDLDAPEESMAVEWARTAGRVTTLSHNYRTETDDLLDVAAALRGGQSIPLDGRSCKVLGAQNHNVGASFVAKNITWWRRVTDDIVILTPVRAEGSPFIRNLLARVEEKPIGKPPCGPFRLRWEIAQEDQCEGFLADLGVPTDPLEELDLSLLLFPPGVSVSAAMLDWIDRRRRLTGSTVMNAGSVRQQISIAFQRQKAYMRTQERGLRVMTIHQAKNREFDSVIVLWPYEAAGTAERKRRMLYNAVTRAKRQAVIIIQNPDRINAPPFLVGE